MEGGEAGHGQTQLQGVATPQVTDSQARAVTAWEGLQSSSSVFGQPKMSSGQNLLHPPTLHQDPGKVRQSLGTPAPTLLLASKVIAAGEHGPTRAVQEDTSLPPWSPTCAECDAQGQQGVRPPSQRQNPGTCKLRCTAGRQPSSALPSIHQGRHVEAPHSRHSPSSVPSPLLAPRLYCFSTCC